MAKEKFYLNLDLNEQDEFEEGSEGDLIGNEEYDNDNKESDEESDGEESNTEDESFFDEEPDED
jgi:hypothetical protein